MHEGRAMVDSLKSGFSRTTVRAALPQRLGVTVTMTAVALVAAALAGCGDKAPQAAAPEVAQPQRERQAEQHGCGQRGGGEEELLQQARDKLTMVLGTSNIGIVKAGRDEHRAPVVVASVQTLARQNRRQRIDFDLDQRLGFRDHSRRFAGNGDDRLMKHWLRAHTLATDVARTAAEAGVAALALHHLIPSDDPAFGPDDWHRACAPHWQGPLHVGKDGLRIDLPPKG